MQSTARILNDIQEKPARPHLTLITTPRLEVSVSVQEPVGYSSEAFPNKTRADFRRYAAHPREIRIRVSGRMAAAILAYHHAKHVGGDGRFLTNTEKQRLERMADYILAEDHAAGLSILRDPYDKARDEDVYIPPGEGAVRFMRKHDVAVYCLADAEEIAARFGVKVCRTCEHPFEGRKNQVDCGPSCRRISKTLWQRADRFGSTELEGERNRMALEYPFYNPQEMYELSQRSEQAYGDHKKISKMDAAKKHKEAHGKKNTVRLVNKDGNYGWTSDRNSWKGKSTSVWWGPMTTYNLRDQPLTESFVDCQSSYTVHT